LKSEIAYLKKLKTIEITTSMLMGVLSDYEDVRGKISSLCKKGLLAPIKQGVYLLNEDLGLRPYSKEILANLIYGPSYISLESALSNYGFIPERVTTTTSICFGRGKSFSTPVGEFEYHHIKESIYAMGVQLKEVFKGTYCQYATPEKALLDFIYLKEEKGAFKNAKDYFTYLLESYRFDLQTIENEISLKKLQTLAESYPFKHIQWFANELIRKILK
jgi:predicted transcriptional regulator of viral defense system